MYRPVMAALATALAWVAASLPAQAQGSDWDKVVAAGKKEGKVVLYNSANGASYFTNVIKSFEQKYGITVDSLDLRASELTERIRAEQVAGRFLGDLELHSTSTIEQQIIDGPTSSRSGGCRTSPTCGRNCRRPRCISRRGFRLTAFSSTRGW